MGGRRTAKKVEVNTQQPSSSSSKKNRKRTLDKTDNGQKEKKFKKESKAKVHKSSINDLPPEMLMKVLKNVDSKSLIGCRLVNRKWNEIASEILQSRPDLELQFNYSTEDEKFVKHTYLQGERRGKSLSSFMKCMQKSKNFPFAHFWFCGVDLSSFSQSDWIKFISDMRKNVRGLQLSIKSTISNEEDLIKMIEKVRDLLLSKLPELEKFGLQFNNSKIPNSSTIPLFPTSSENPKSKTTIRLPHLKVLYLDDLMFSKYTGIVKDILSASVNLQKIERLYNYGKHINLGHFQLLQSLGKLSCLQASSVQPVEFLSKNVEENPSALLEFKLKTLDLNLMVLYKNENLWSDAAVLLSKLFESNKDTLTELEMDSLGFLDDLKLPKFSKLTSLSTHEPNGFQHPLEESLLPSEINPMEVFPALRSLSLEGISWSTAFPNENNTHFLPTLETLSVSGADMTKTTIAQISFFCPNLKNFEITPGDGYLDKFLEVGRAIWIHLKKLQSLKIWADAGYSAVPFPDYDSAITGFSNEDCKRLYDLLLAKELLKKYGFQANIPQSEFEAERKYPSILDLKDLKFFQLHAYCCNWNGEVDIELDLTKKGPTELSKKYAFDLMDNLVYDIDKIVN